MYKFKLDFTKVFDVKSPIGVEQREKKDESNLVSTPTSV